MTQGTCPRDSLFLSIHILARREEKKRLHEQTPEPVKKTIERLQRKIFYLFMFLGEQDLYTEAKEYLEEHMDEPTPFEDVW